MLHQSFVIPKWKAFEGFSNLLVTMSWASNKLWSSTIASKIVIHQWRVNNVLIGPQQANITVSLTKCRLRSCRTSKSLSKNLRTRWWINIGLVHSILSEDLNRLVGSWNLKAVAWQINRLFSSHLIQTLLAKYNISLTCQASYSLDMAPYNFWMFPSWKYY